MNTSEQYHQPVLEALSAFVRDSTRVPEDHRANSRAKPRQTDKGDRRPATDVQAALTVIRRRAAIGTGSPDLSEAHIPYADLHGADLTHANLTHANLSAAILDDADLHSADLSGADLSGAILNAAQQVYANLSGANLNDAQLGYANLSGANLNDADLSGANLSDARISQGQLDQACGTGVKGLDKLSPPLTIKPCP